MSVTTSEPQSTSVTETATAEKTTRTFFGSTLKELLPLIIVLVVSLAFAGFLVANHIAVEIADAERQARFLEQMKGLVVRP